MALGTHSKFFFIDEIDSTNQNINFNEGSGELTAVVQSGSYTIENMMLAIKTAMDSVGTQEYTVDFDRVTRRVSFTAAGNFDLLVTSGTQVGTSPWLLIGFTGPDLTGTNTYTGQSSAGEEYKTQFWIQDYVAPGFRKRSIQASRNESASGRVENIKFGKVDFIEMNLKFITDNPNLGCGELRSITNGVQKALDFLDFITNLQPIEFMPDENDQNTFYGLLLEKTTLSTKGVDFELKEEVGKDLPGIYTTGKLIFRVRV